MIDIENLSNDERLALIEQLWNSLSVTPENVPITGTQKLELDRRVSEMDADDDAGVPAELVLSRLAVRQASYGKPNTRLARILR